MQISISDFKEYVAGWLFVNSADPSFQNLDLNNMKAALLNAANCLDCPSDGIHSYVGRKEFFSHPMQKDLDGPP
jgi:hypothetical protein